MIVLKIVRLTLQTRSSKDQSVSFGRGESGKILISKGVDTMIFCVHQPIIFMYYMVFNFNNYLLKLLLCF